MIKNNVIKREESINGMNRGAAHISKKMHFFAAKGGGNISI